MRGAPIPPAEYDGEHLDTDEKLEAAGWAAGLDVWEQVGKGYSEWYLKDDTLGNAQLWSLQEAIRAEERARLEVAGRLLSDDAEVRTEWTATARTDPTDHRPPPRAYRRHPRPVPPPSGRGQRGGWMREATCCFGTASVANGRPAACIPAHGWR